METVLAFLEKIGNYLLLVRFTDILDVIIIAFLVYKLLDLVRSTRAENILKGVVMFLLALWLSEIFHLYGIAYILGNMVQVGILALIILFQDDGAVMHGGLDEENVFQQLGGHCRVQHRAAADHIVQQNLPICPL